MIFSLLFTVFILSSFTHGSNTSIDNAENFSNYAFEFFHQNKIITLFDEKNNKYIFQKEYSEESNVNVYICIEYNGQQSRMLEQSLELKCTFPEKNSLILELSKLYTKYIRSIANIQIYAKFFLHLLQNIHNHAKFSMLLKLSDSSDLQLIFLGKFGYSFYEKYDFYYTQPMNEIFRNFYSEHLTIIDKTFLREKYKINFSFNITTTFKDFIYQMESEKYQHFNLQDILIEICSYKFRNIRAPTYMIYRQNNFNENILKKCNNSHL